MKTISKYYLRSVGALATPRYRRKSFRMKIDSWRLVLLLATAVSFIGYPNPASAATFNVQVGAPNFRPGTVTIHPGDQVRWTWASSGHSTTSLLPMPAGSLWDSGVRNRGATFTHTFNTAGTFFYRCSQHSFLSPPHELGRVIVNASLPTTPQPVADFNLDGKPDYALFNASTRQTAVWYIDNNVRVGGSSGPAVPPGWQLVAVGGFDRNGHPDYLLFNPTTGQTVIWYLSGVTHTSSNHGPTLPGGWNVVALADFNGDGYPDYVLYNANTRATAVWYMHNNELVSHTAGPTLPAGWSLAGAVDFNGDEHPDYLLLNASTGQTVIWYMNGTTHITGRHGPVITAGYELVGAVDFDGNGGPDYVLYNPSTHQTAIWYMDDNVVISSANGPTVPGGWSLVAP
jgi:plastocyanin